MHNVYRVCYLTAATISKLQISKVSSIKEPKHLNWIGLSIKYLRFTCRQVHMSWRA